MYLRGDGDKVKVDRSFIDFRCARSVYYSIKYRVYTVHCTSCTLYIVYNVHRTMYMLCVVHCTMYIVTYFTLVVLMESVH